MRNNLYENCYINCVNDFNTGLVDTTRYPASASFIDVGLFTHFAFLIHAGTLDTATTLAVYQDTSATETASIKAVSSATVTIGATDDNDWLSIEVEAAQLDLANDFRFVTLVCSNAAGGNDYADIVFIGWNNRHVPVTQESGYNTSVRVAG